MGPKDVASKNLFTANEDPDYVQAAIDAGGPDVKLSVFKKAKDCSRGTLRDVWGWF